MSNRWKNKKNSRVKRITILLITVTIFTLGLNVGTNTQSPARTTGSTTPEGTSPAAADSPDSVSGTATNIYLDGSTYGSITRSIDPLDWKDAGGGVYYFDQAGPSDPDRFAIEVPDNADWTPDFATLSVSDLHETRDWDQKLDGTNRSYSDTRNYAPYITSAYTGSLSRMNSSYTLAPRYTENEHIITRTVSPTYWSTTPTLMLDNDWDVLHYYGRYQHGWDCGDTHQDESTASSYYVEGEGARSAGECYAYTPSENWGTNWNGRVTATADGRCRENNHDGLFPCGTYAHTDYDVTLTRQWVMRQTINRNFQTATIHSCDVRAVFNLQMHDWSSHSWTAGGGGSGDFTRTYSAVEGYIRIRDNAGHAAETPKTSISHQISLTPSQPNPTRDWSSGNLVITGDLGWFFQQYKDQGTLWYYEVVLEVTTTNSGSLTAERVGDPSDVQSYSREWAEVDVLGESNAPYALMDYSQNIPSDQSGMVFTSTTDQLNWGGRWIDDDDYPVVTFRYSVPFMREGSGPGLGNLAAGATLAFFMEVPGPSQHIVTKAGLTLSELSAAGEGQRNVGVAQITFTQTARDWLRSTGAATVKIGVGVYISGTFRLLGGPAMPANYEVHIMDLTFSARAVPTTDQISLKWQLFGFGGEEKAITTTGLGTGASRREDDELGAFPGDRTYRFMFSHESVRDVELSWSLTMYLKLRTTEKTIAMTYEAGYIGGHDPLRAYFVGSKNVPYPSVTHIDSNYPGNTELNVTFPRYELKGETYWNSTKTRISTAQYYSYPLDLALGRADPVWQGSPSLRATWLGRWNRTAGAQNQILYLEPELLGTLGNWNMEFTFDAPNEIDAAEVDLSKETDFSELSDEYLTKTWVNTRCNLVDQLDEDEVTVDTTFKLEYYDPTDASYFTNTTQLANGASLTAFEWIEPYSWQADATHGHGDGFTSTAAMTREYNSHPDNFNGVFRVGFGKNEFAVVRETAAELWINETLWDTNQYQNGELLAIEVNWTDLSGTAPRSIAIDDGEGGPITARITISEWTVNVEENKVGNEIDTDGWTTTENGGTKMIGEEWILPGHEGNFSAHVDPKSVYNPGGNMTQGWHNFTVRLERYGYQTQVITGNFSIIVDTFLEMSSPSHETASKNYTHYMEDGAQALKPFDIRGAICQRLGSFQKISNGTGKFYEGAISMNYELTKIGRPDPALDGRYGELHWAHGENPGDLNYWTAAVNWSLVNLTWIENNAAVNPKHDPGLNYNYHNGSFSQSDEYGYNFEVSIVCPPYQNNSAGYGDIDSVLRGNHVNDKAVEKTLYYNVTYSVAQNFTMIYNPDGSLQNTFQPNTIGSYRSPAFGDSPQVVNGSCERPKMTGGWGGWDYGPWKSAHPNELGTLDEYLGTEDYDHNYETSGTLEGRKREEWVRIFLHREFSGNITMLRLYNASWLHKYDEGQEEWYPVDPDWYTVNASDCGWAFNSSEAIYDGRDPFFGSYGYENPRPVTYKGSQYWKNATTYPYEEPYIPGASGYEPGIETRYHNNTQEIRFRVIYNCTWSESAFISDPTIDEPKWGDDATEDIHPRCGPLNASSSYGFDGEAELYLYNWNATPIELTPDPFHKFLWNVSGYGDGAPEFYTVTGDTWVTPWLNLTEHEAINMDGEEEEALRIEATKKGFYPASLTIEYNIKDQKTALQNATGGDQTLVVDGDGNKNPLAPGFDVKTRWNKTIDFYVNYTDVTNNVSSAWNRINAPEPISNATITIPDKTGDSSPGDLFWADNYGNDYWNYSCVAPGIYRIRFVNTGFTNIDADTKLEFTFRIAQQNFTAINFAVNLTIMKRRVMFQILNTTVLSGVYLDSVRYPASLLSNPYYQQLNLSFQVLDVDDAYKPVNLSYYLEEDQTLNDFLDFSPITTSPVYQNTSLSGNIIYNISIYTGIPVGAHTIPLKLSDLPNYRNHVNNSVTFFVEEARTEFINLTTTVNHYRYVHPNQHAYIDNYATFKFQVQDLDRSARYGDDYNDTLSLLENHLSISQAPWSNRLAFTGGWTWMVEKNEFENSTTLDGWPISYNQVNLTLVVNITGLPASAVPYVLDVTISKPNFETRTAQLAFYIDPAPTVLYNVYLNDEFVYSEGTAIYGPTTPLICPWNNSLDVSFGWGYVDQNGRQWALAEETTLPVDITVTGWFPGKTSAWWTQAGGVIEYNTYGFTLATDPSTVTLPHDQAVQFAIQKNNFVTATLPLTIRLRERELLLRTMENINLGIETNSRDYRVEYGSNFTLGFELQDAEEDTNIVEPYPYDSLQNITVLDHYAGQSFTASVGGIAVPAFLTYQPRYEVDGLHHYYNLTLAVDNLNVSATPYATPVNVTKAFSEVIAFTLNITIVPKVFNFETTVISPKGTPGIVDVETDTYFWLKVDLRDPATGQPFPGGLFNVTYQFSFLNETSGVLTPQTWQYASGALPWNASTQKYETQLPVTEDMVGTFRVTFNIVSTDGNYAPVEFTTVIFFQDPIPEVPTSVYVMLVLSILLVVGVSGYTIRKALQLRIPLVLRMIDESIKKITEDKYPSIGVMKPRREFIVQSIVEKLEEVGVEWDQSDKFSMDEISGPEDERPPLAEEDIQKELEQIISLSPDERMLFVEELKRLERPEQEEFIESLREDAK